LYQTIALLLGLPSLDLRILTFLCYFPLFN